MVYDVLLSSKFKKQLKKIKRRQKNTDKLGVIVEKLIHGVQLDERYCDHALTNSRRFKDCRECHIEPDWLLVYRIIENELQLLLVETGTHSDLFG